MLPEANAALPMLPEANTVDSPGMTFARPSDDAGHQLLPHDSHTRTTIPSSSVQFQGSSVQFQGSSVQIQGSSVQLIAVRIYPYTWLSA